MMQDFTAQKVVNLPFDIPLLYSVYHENGEILFHKGAQLNPNHFKYLKAADITTVFLSDNDEEEAIQKFRFERTTLPIKEELIQEGAVFDRDIINNFGSVVVPTGTPVSRFLYQKLIDTGTEDLRFKKNQSDLKFDQLIIYKELLEGTRTFARTAAIPTPSASKTALIAEDDGPIRRILVHILQDANFKTFEAGDGQIALDTLRENDKVDLVVTDVNMPKMDGFELCRQIKKWPERMHIPVIICTCRNTRDDILTALKAGATDYILKPFSKEIVLNKVLETVKTTVPFTQERRKHPRNQVGIAITWSPLDKEVAGVIYNAKVINLSPSGICFEYHPDRFQVDYPRGEIPSTHPFFKYSRFNPQCNPIKLFIGQPPTVIDISGKVIHIQLDRARQCEIVGIQFEPLEPEQELMLIKLAQAVITT